MSVYNGPRDGYYREQHRDRDDDRNYYRQENRRNDPEITIITEMIFVADGKKEMAKVMSLDAVMETVMEEETETEKEDNSLNPNSKRQRL